MNAPFSSSSDTESVWTLRLDIATAKIVIWVVSGGREVELTDETHLYFYDRYARLATHHRRCGHAKRAHALQVKAEEHLELGGGDGPPYAAAVGMPRPTRWFSTDAVGRDHSRKK